MNLALVLLERMMSIQMLLVLVVVCIKSPFVSAFRVQASSRSRCSNKKIAHRSHDIHIGRTNLVLSTHQADVNAFRRDDNDEHPPDTLVGHRHHSQSVTLNTQQALEEQERREMQWLLRTTSSLLHPQDAKSSSTLTSTTITPALLRKAHLAMKAWSARTIKRAGTNHTLYSNNAPHMVEQILTRLVQQQRDVQTAGMQMDANNMIHIDTKTYNIVIHAWSKSDCEGAAERALEILDQMERFNDKSSHEHVKPDYDSYLGVIKAFVRDGSRRDTVHQVEAVIQRMKRAKSRDSSNNGSNNLSPGRRGYNLFLYALANSNHDHVGERALHILETMKEEYQAGNSQCQPNVNTYNQVLTALGRETGNERKADQVFAQVMDSSHVFPDTDTFNAILKCWCHSKEYRSLAHMKHIWTSMMECHVEPDLVTANTMLAALARKRDGNNSTLNNALSFFEHMERDYQLSPNTVSFNLMIDCWTKSGRPDALARVMELLQEMETQFKGANSAVKPDAWTYASVIACVSKRDKANAGPQADALVERMTDLYQNHGGDIPNTAVYNACLNAWATMNEDGVDRVESILRQMEQDHNKRQEIPAPNIMTYNTALKAMRTGRDDHAARAEQLLCQMEGKAKQDISLAPDSYSFTSVITAYARTQQAEKATKALSILERMIDSYEAGNLAAKPKIHPFNACLNACAFTCGRDEGLRMEALFITVSIIFLLRKYACPDSITYSTALRAASTLLPPDDRRRDIIAKSIFKRACREGQVDRMVIKQMEFASSSELYQHLLGKRRVRIRDLALEWTSKARQQQYMKSNRR